MTKVGPLEGFYPAEAYHQDYLTLHPTQPYIAYNDIPKVENLKKLFADELHREADAGEQRQGHQLTAQFREICKEIPCPTPRRCPARSQKSEAEWRKELTPMQYAVLREKATERPFSGEYEHEHRAGHLHLRRLRPDAVRIRRQVRFRLRLAEFHRSPRWRAMSTRSATSATA